MDKHKALDILRRYQEWRRYNGFIGEGPEMPNPKEIGEAIDYAIYALEMMENEQEG
jgi:hypothetical protein